MSKQSIEAIRGELHHAAAGQDDIDSSHLFFVRTELKFMWQDTVKKLLPAPLRRSSTGSTRRHATHG
ncbi:hypothetical protein ACFFWD_00605 [Bradyrhizobium erythrophlei]